jgi:hypothetical protein
VVIAQIFGVAAIYAPATSGLPVAVWLIVVLVAVALLCQLSLLRRYARLRSVSAAAAEGESSDEKTPPAIGAILLGIRESARRLGASFQPDAAVETVHTSENQLFRAALVRWTTGSVLIIGLAGTFLAFVQLISGSGLLEALGSLRSTPQSDSISPQLAESYAALSIAFTRVYESLGFAFLSSLSGLAGTIVLGFVGSVFLQGLKTRALLSVQGYAERVYEITAPPNQTEELASSLLTAAEALKNSSQAIETLRVTSKLLNAAAGRFEQAEAATVQLASTLTSLTSELQTSHARWDLLVEALRDSKTQQREILEAFKKDAAGQREQTNRAVASAASGMRELAERIAEEIKKVSAAKMDQFIRIQEELRAVLQETRNDWEKAGAEVIAQTGVAFANSLSAVHEVISQSRQDAASAQAEMASLTQHAVGVVTTHQATLEGHTKSVAASLEHWSNVPAGVERTITSLADSVTKLTPALERVERMPNQWEDRVLGSIRQLDARLLEAQEEARIKERSGRRGAVQRIRDWLRERFRGKSPT